MSSLADVVVTARQRNETVLEAPLAIRAFTPSDIAQARAIQLSDLSGFAPGFSLDKAGGVETVFIRGVGGGGRNIGFGARTAIYLDGVYVAQPAALNQMLSDAERVEILRGPQGALFGRNTVSGAVNIVSRTPGSAPGAAARLWAGSRDNVGAVASLDLPLDGSRLAVRASAARERRGGFTSNLTDGSDIAGSVDLASTRLALRFAPDDRWRLDVAADYALDKSQRDSFESASNPVGAGTSDPFAPAPFTIAENSRRLRRNEQYGANLNIGYATAAADWTAVTAYRRADAHRRSDNDYSPLALLATDYHDLSGQWSQELRVAGRRGSSLRYGGGLFWLEEIARSDRVARFGADTLRAGLPVAPGSVVPARARIANRSTAAFANLDWSFNRAWTLGAALRLNRDRKRLEFDLDGRQSGLLRIATLTGFRDRIEESRPTPAVTLRYAPTPRLGAYLRYAEGFKSGGWNVDFLNVSQTVSTPGAGRPPFAFEPETVKSYEAGMKLSVLGGRGWIDAALFSARFQDYQINQFVAVPGGGTVLQLTNASRASTEGVEISGEYRASDNLRITADAGLLEAEFGDFPGGGSGGRDASGNRLPFAPRVSLGVTAEVAAPVASAWGRISFWARYRHRSTLYTGQENEPTQRIAPTGLVDARLAWRPPRATLELAVWGRNLTDTRYLTNRVRDFLGTQTVARGDPRTYGLELTSRF